jgi:hypothetical protein
MGLAGNTFGASGFCRQATRAPNNKAAEEKTKPRDKPPGPSAIHPTTVGPTICPTANTTVKTLIPDAHKVGGKLCFTMAVVEATTDKNTPPNMTPDKSIMGRALVSTGINVATLSNTFKMANAWPPR